MAYSYIPASAKNYTKNRAAQGGKIKKITVHHMAGNLTIEQLGNLWANPTRQGSSHYGVNGANIGQYVLEADIAWTDSNWTSNINSVTIETANSGGAPNWPASDTTLETLCVLVADIAKRNNLGKLVPGQNLTWHSMYAATACPGPYLKSKMQYIADRANAINSGGESAPALTNGELRIVEKTADGTYVPRMARKYDGDSYTVVLKAMEGELLPGEFLVNGY